MRTDFTWLKWIFFYISATLGQILIRITKDERIAMALKTPQAATKVDKNY